MNLQQNTSTFHKMVSCPYDCFSLFGKTARESMLGKRKNLSKKAHTIYIIAHFTC